MTIQIADSALWLGLAIGNSRLHWACFRGESLLKTWDTPHLMGEAQIRLPSSLAIAHPSHPDPSHPDLWIASVVPAQTERWRNYPGVQIVTLNDVPLDNLYATLGVDRVVALWGAQDQVGFPALVIDAGTALTFSAADPEARFMGGAILPGLRSQFQTLSQKTAALPDSPLPPQLPLRWACDTQTAIQSGILYSVLAGICDFIEDWWQQCPQGAVVLTGGDSQVLQVYLRDRYPALAARLVTNPDLVFWGLRSLRRLQHQG